MSSKSGKNRPLIVLMFLLGIMSISCATMRAVNTPAPPPQDRYVTPTRRPTITPIFTLTVTPTPTITLVLSITPTPDGTLTITASPTPSENAP